MESNLATVQRIHAAMISSGGSVLGDRKSRDALVGVLEEVADPGLECMMAGAGGFHADSTGVAGVIAVWADWLSAFEDVGIEVEDLVEASPDCVVDFIRMSGRSSRGGAEMTSEGGAAWFFSGGRLSRVEFHLDREQLRRAGGLGPSA